MCIRDRDTQGVKMTHSLAKKGSTVTGAYYANEIVYTPATRGIEHKAKSCDMGCMWYC